MTGAHNRFATEGDALQLNCSQNMVNSWQSGTKEFLVVCEGGKPMINFNLSISSRINISSDCTILTITNFTKDDVGITIIEANGTKVIIRKEGDSVTLTCKVEGLRKDDKLFWFKENIMQSSDKTSDSITYKFIANRSDNMKELVCLANNSVYTRPLAASVRLILILKPRIKILSSQNPVITKGQTIILTCYDENEKSGYIDAFLWTHNSSLLTYNTNNLTIENATQSIAGEYVCIANNTAGMDNASITILVNCSPVVRDQSVTLFTSNGPRTLECSAEGVPDVYNFGIWQHYTYTNELVRSLEGKPVLAKPHHNSYIGKMYATSIMSIFVLSSSNVTRAIWFSEHKAPLKVTPCTLTIAETLFYGIPVRVSGYECQVKINDTRREDLQKYKVDITNKYGISTFEISLILAEEKSNDTQNYWVAFFLVFVVIIPVCIVLTRWRLRRGGAIENNLFQGANNFIEQPSVSSSREDEAYSCIDRRMQIVHKQNVTYQISRRDQLENKDHHQSSINNGLNPPNLNYVEVVFDNTTHNGAFCIHGADSRTPYADIDFSARADPLIISEENEESLSSHIVENDDFVSLEEVQQWMIVNE
ncbi:unnamed protein product [Mytilus edulis]|uniref:Ig-like domain-containing protein n=1 Tax=Mytilus edulis TaxID=6550 RepID=A0A8S3UEH2_MYTED|nr:unnamed protein product [Mytilus edulis]